MYKAISKQRHWILPILWMIIIFMFSNQPATESSKLSSSVTEKFLHFLGQAFPKVNSDIDWWHGFIRKNAHFFIYFVLGGLLVKPFKIANVKRPYISAFAFSLLYAISDETHQLFIEGRVGHIRDVIIDSLGALTGISVYKLSEKHIGFLKRTRR